MAQLNQLSYQQLLSLVAKQPTVLVGQDLPALLNLACWHKALPHLYRFYQKQAKPESAIQKAIATAYQSVQMLALKQAADLVQIQKAFDTSGIDCLHLKGVTLAQLLYKTPAGKQSTDLDILISADKIKPASEALLKIGYRPAGLPTDQKEQAYIEKITKDRLWLHPSRTPVELHWRLQKNKHFFPASFETLWQNRQHLNVAGTRLATLGQQDLLLYLAIHTCTYCKRLSWVLDLAAYIEQNNFDWPQCLKQAQKLGFDRAFVAVVTLACELQGLACPKIIQNTFLKDKACQRIKHFFERKLKGGPSAELVLYQLYCFSLFNSQVNQARQFFSHYNNHLQGRYHRWYRLKIPRAFFSLAIVLEPVFMLYYGLKHIKCFLKRHA